MKHWRVSPSLSLLAFSVPLLAFGCSSSEGPAAPPTSDAGVDPPADAEAPAQLLSFTPCPLRVDAQGPQAECATVLVPLDAKNPNGPTIDVFVKRYRPAGGRGLRQLWLLQGGPGASGYVFENISQQFGTKYKDVDYYIPDHRGTGKSTRLGCPAQEASSSEGGISITETEMPACFADVKAREGARLPFFTTTNAANDIGVLISRTREKIPGTDTVQPAFVMGISYGTYWAHRYLQLYPEQPAGIIFDSVAPQGASLARQDADSDEAAKDFLAACGADTFCSSKLGAGLAPWDKAQALFAKLKTGHCSEIAVSAGPTHVLFRRAFASMLMQPQLRTYIPAVIHRADRCSAADVTSLKFFMKAISQPAPEDEMMRQWGWMLSYNVIFSEMWETPEPAPGELAGIRDRAIASRDITAMMEAALPLWSRYPADPLATSWATSDKPLLFLNGGLDPATLLRKARLAKPHFTKPNQHWVEVPSASHTVIGSSPLPEGGSCGTRMFMSFMENPTAPLDTSCVAKVVPLDFTNTVDRDLTRGLFGRYDAWE